MFRAQIEFDLPTEGDGDAVSRWSLHCVACMTTRDRLSAETRLCSYCDRDNCTIENAKWCREMGYMDDPTITGVWT